MNDFAGSLSPRHIDYIHSPQQPQFAEYRHNELEVMDLWQELQRGHGFPVDT